MKQRVVTFHYTVKSDKGETIDSSIGADPMAFLEGSGQIIPGLEATLKLLKAGEKKSVTIEPAQAYGERDKELVFSVPRAKFPAGEKVEVGMKFRAGSPDEPSPVFTVTSVTDAEVGVDGNHPLAGQTLHFDVEVTAVRDATEEELAHGHSHGHGGHHH
jgi:FKBP-type peptidyl-prolyl cis-trans isomerase SlyD